MEWTDLGVFPRIVNVESTVDLVVANDVENTQYGWFRCVEIILHSLDSSEGFFRFVLGKLFLEPHEILDELGMDARLTAETEHQLQARHTSYGQAEPEAVSFPDWNHRPGAKNDEHEGGCLIKGFEERLAFGVVASRSSNSKGQVIAISVVCFTHPSDAEAPVDSGAQVYPWFSPGRCLRWRLGAAYHRDECRMAQDSGSG